MVIFHSYVKLPEGKTTNPTSLDGHRTFIVDVPIKNGDFPIKLPEGILRMFMDKGSHQRISDRLRRSSHDSLPSAIF